LYDQGTRAGLYVNGKRVKNLLNFNPATSLQLVRQLSNSINYNWLYSGGDWLMVGGQFLGVR